MPSDRYLGQSYDEEPSKLQQVMKALGDRMLRASAGAGDRTSLSLLNQPYEQEQQRLKNEREDEELGLRKQALEQQRLDRISNMELRRASNKGSAMNVEQEFRNELKPYTKNMMEVDTAYRKVEKAANNPSAAGDLALIFNYMKMLDPGSTVREGEFATAQNTAGVPDRIRKMYNKATEGERLAPNQRQDFINQAKNAYTAQYESYNNMVQPYKDLSNQYGANFENVALYKAIPPSVASGGGATNKIIVSNGKETLRIDPSDLGEAQSDGFQVVK